MRRKSKYRLKKLFTSSILINGRRNDDLLFEKTTAMSEPEPLAHKIVIVGDSDVGKTSIIRVFDEQTFNPSVSPTVGASFLSKTVVVNQSSVILNIWDTAGQERYRSLIPTYAHGARAAILCYDTANGTSFEAIDAWLESLQRFCSPDCLLFLVGNKIDLEPAVPQATAKKWAQEHNAQCLFTSAADGAGVKELFKAIAEALSQMVYAREPARLRANTGGGECGC
jgi:small GTP-binding protein